MAGRLTSHKYSIVNMFRHGGQVSDMESSVATHISYNNVAEIAGNATASTVLEAVQVKYIYTYHIHIYLPVDKLGLSKYCQDSLWNVYRTSMCILHWSRKQQWTTHASEYATQCVNDSVTPNCALFFVARTCPKWRVRNVRQPARSGKPYKSLWWRYVVFLKMRNQRTPETLIESQRVPPRCLTFLDPTDVMEHPGAIYTWVGGGLHPTHFRSTKSSIQF